MKKFLISVIGLLLITLIVANCTVEKPATQSGTSSTTTSTEVVELKMSTFLPPEVPAYKFVEEWAAKVSEKTNGQIKIILFPASTLLADKDLLPGLKAGIADIAHMGVQALPDQFPLTNILRLPFTNINDPWKCSEIWTEVENKFPEVSDEFKDYKVLLTQTNGGAQIHTVKKEIRVPGDLKGVKIFSQGIIMEIMQDIGASPMFMPPPEWFTGLDRGVIDGMVMGVDAIYEMHLYTLLPYHTIVPSGLEMGLNRVIMSDSAWNKLPSSAQQVFEELTPWGDEALRQLNDDGVKASTAGIEAEGGKYVTITEDEEKIWAEAAKPAIDKYINKLEAEKLPARSVYDEILRLAAGN